METKEFKEKLRRLIWELDSFPETTPIEMITTARHICCSEPCYQDGEDFRFSHLSISVEDEFDKATKKRKLKKLWIRGL